MKGLAPENRLIPPLTPAPANVSLQNPAENCFFKAWLSSLMAQGPGEARHYIAAAPGPPNRFRLLPLQASRHVPVHRGGPPKPRNCVSTRVSFEFRAFPGPLKHKDPKGVQSRMCCHSFLGFGFNSKPQPHRRVGLKIPLARRVHSPVVRHTGTLSAISIPKLSFANLHPGWGSQNRMNGGDGKSVDREQRWVDFLIDFQR